MACVYILFSEKLNKFYVGSSKELINRIDQHLSKEFRNSFTSKAEDWKLYLSVEDLKHHQARSIEKHIKKAKSSTYIKSLNEHAGIIERLKIKYKEENETK